MPLSATDHRRIALFSGLLNRAPISGNVPYLFGWKRQFVGVHRYKLCTVLDVWTAAVPGGLSGTAFVQRNFQRKGNLMARVCAAFWKNPSFSGNSGTRAYA
jgi:hypothetical protein